MGQLVGWLVGWLVGGRGVELVCWLVYGLVVWLFGRSVGWLVNWLVCW